MPPYYLCKVTKCTKSIECYRFRASPEIGQLYHDFSVTLCNAENNYKFMMKIRPDDKIDDITLELNSLEEFIEKGEN